MDYKVVFIWPSVDKRVFHVAAILFGFLSFTQFYRIKVRLIFVALHGEKDNFSKDYLR